jgi:hypothetical protein
MIISLNDDGIVVAAIVHVCTYVLVVIMVVFRFFKIIQKLRKFGWF